ncbi:MAG: hypothetical protein HY868_07760 [Chloroflexi bacterium]|nr:hypothetical protein [Chloroflexota bacterium]
MSSYTNFIKDFPTRCLELFDKTFDQTRINGREVTLLLSIATVAFNIPFERLRAKPEKHPADDVTRYPEAKKKFDKEINKSFRCHWGQGDTWKFIEGVDGKDIRGCQVDQWARPEARESLSNKKEANSVFSHLRNALAHGSIFTYPNYSGTSAPPQIETIVFLRQCRERKEIEKCCQERDVDLDKYDVLLVSPQDFLAFLKKWVEFLNSLDLSTSP